MTKDTKTERLDCERAHGRLNRMKIINPGFWEELKAEADNRGMKMYRFIEDVLKLGLQQLKDKGEK